MGIALSRNLKPMVPSYMSLQTDVDLMFQNQISIEKVTKSETSFYYRFKRFFCQYFLGIKQPSLEELFGLQVRYIKRLNFDLNLINQQSRRELLSLENYSDRISSEFFGASGFKNENLDSLIARIDGLESNYSVDPEEFMRNKIELRRLKRSLDEKLHKQKLSEDVVEDLSKEDHYLEVIESLLRISVHTCERLQKKVGRLERHLVNTQNVYHFMRAQQVNVGSLVSAVDTMSGFTSQIQDILGAGLSDMVSVVDGYDVFGNLGHKSFYRN